MANGKLALRVCFKALVYLLCAALISDSAASQSNSCLQIPPHFLRDGDIIFRRGVDVVSQMVLMGEATANFSHVGLIVMDDDLVYVIHAMPSEGENGADQVKVESLESFMSPEKTSAIRVMRLQPVANRSLRIVQMLAFAKQQIGKGFDFDLDASDDGKFYCTELVAKAYLAAGLQLVDDKQLENFPLLPDRVIPLSAIMQSQLLTTVWDGGSIGVLP